MNIRIQLCPFDGSGNHPARLYLLCDYDPGIVGVPSAALRIRDCLKRD